MGTALFGLDETHLNDYHPDVDRVREMEIVLSRCLPSFHRQAFRCMAYQLYTFEGLTIREIAIILGVTQSSVKSRVFRARTALRDLAGRLKLQRSTDATRERIRGGKRNSSLRGSA